MKITEEIIKVNLRFIYKECLKVSKPSKNNWEDIKQEGIIAFCKAYEQYDESKDTKGFYYYASKYIRLHLLHYIDTKCNGIHYSKKIQTAIYEIRKEKKNGKELEDILNNLKFSYLDQLEYLACIAERSNKAIYLSDLVSDTQSDDKELEVFDRLLDIDVQDDFSDMLFNIDIERLLKEFEAVKCKKLYEDNTKQEVAMKLLRGVIEGKEENQKEIAERYNLSRSMVNRIRKTVLLEFKNELIDFGLINL